MILHSFLLHEIYLLYIFPHFFIRILYSRKSLPRAFCGQVQWTIFERDNVVLNCLCTWLYELSPHVLNFNGHINRQIASENLFCYNKMYWLALFHVMQISSARIRHCFEFSLRSLMSFFFFLNKHWTPLKWFRMF